MLRFNSVEYIMINQFSANTQTLCDKYSFHRKLSSPIIIASSSESNKFPESLAKMKTCTKGSGCPVA